MSIKRLHTCPDEHYFWRSLSLEEWTILTEHPEEYGCFKDKLKELYKAKRLKDDRCVQVSLFEAEARGWLKAGAVALIRIPRSKLAPDDWEFSEDQPFPVVKAASVVANHEVMAGPA